MNNFKYLYKLLGEPIDQIFKKISHINENGQIDDVKKSLNQNQNQNQAGNTVQNLNGKIIKSVFN